MARCRPVGAPRVHEFAGTETDVGIGAVGASLNLPGVLGTSGLTAANTHPPTMGPPGSLAPLVQSVVKNGTGVTGISNSSVGVLGVAAFTPVPPPPPGTEGLPTEIAALLAPATPSANTSVGVFGWSFAGRGGVFGSAIPWPELTSPNLPPTAQIRLIPAPSLVDRQAKTVPSNPPFHPTLPKDGQPGDLLVVNVNTGGDEDLTVRLWLCVQAAVQGPAGSQNATWARIAFDQIIQPG